MAKVTRPLRPACRTRSKADGAAAPVLPPRGIGRGDETGALAVAAEAPPATSPARSARRVSLKVMARSKPERQRGCKSPAPG